MIRKRVRASRDHIQSLAKAYPLQAIEELIWNGLDAGGPIVEVRFKLNKMSAIQTIEVVDKGTGIPHHELNRAFGALGDSKKLTQKVTDEGRVLHGREGRGRFKALSLCPQPEWTTTYRKDGKYLRYTVKISRTDPDYFASTKPEEVRTKQTGTTVRLDFVDQGGNSLQTENTHETLTQRFALYLSEYPTTSIVYDGELLKVDHLIDRKQAFELPTEVMDRPKATLKVIEWKFKIDTKKLYLCNDAGFSYYDMPARVQAPGIDYTAYLCSPEVDDWFESGRFAVAELDEDIQKVVELARERLRTYVRERLAEDAQDVVDEWKKLDIYPYAKHEVSNPLKTAERSVFDIVAVRVNEQHPTFHKSDTDNKRLTLALIRQALESNPSSLTTILRDVIELPPEEQDEFADLLQRTKLSSLIKAGRLVTERLDLVQAFEHILFDKDWKKRLLERTQLHRLLVHELWVLSEEYALATDDEGLQRVLQQHLRILERDELAPEVDVKQIDGTDGIPDLMLSRRRRVDRSQFEHLVVELKRPSLRLGQTEIGQIQKYAITVAADERFNTQRVSWMFILLGNEFDRLGQELSSIDGLPPGCTYRRGGVSVWVRTWADVLADTKARYEFFREQLELEASATQGMECLTAKYKHLMTGRGATKKKDQEISAKPADTHQQ